MSDEKSANAGFVFTNNWFDSTAKKIWDVLIPKLNPRKILEIGSYEGASACYLIGQCASKAPIEIHCIDPWGERTGAGAHIAEVERRFLNNTKLASEQSPHKVELIVHKGHSLICLSELVSSKMFSNYFDMIYIDGSHIAPDVLADAVLSFPLLRIAGFMVFDDYLWSDTPQLETNDPLRCPKAAIDAFINTYFRKMRVVGSPNSQICAVKIAE